MALCPATATDPGPRGRAAIRLEDSAPADRTSSGVSAQSVLRDTTASPTADVSPAPRALLPLSACRRSLKRLLSPVCSVRVRPSPVRRGDGEMHLPPSDGETVLRRVPGPDFQLSPPAGLRRLRMLSDRNRRRHEARLRPPLGTVQVCESASVCARWPRVLDHCVWFLCSCKPRIGGRRCDRCAAGHYRFPECLPCNCNRDGVTPDVCHPDSGRCLCKVTPSRPPVPSWTFLSARL